MSHTHFDACCFSDSFQMCSILLKGLPLHLRLFGVDSAVLIGLLQITTINSKATIHRYLGKESVNH